MSLVPALKESPRMKGKTPKPLRKKAEEKVRTSVRREVPTWESRKGKSSKRGTKEWDMCEECRGTFRNKGVRRNRLMGSFKYMRTK